MKILILLISTLFIKCASQGLTCHGGHIVHMHSDGFVFPTGWTTDQPASFIKPHQKCGWSVTVPNGKVAKLQILATLDKESVIQTVNAYGISDRSDQENLDPWIFVPPKFTLILDENEFSNGTYFSFKITWIDFPTQTTSLKVTQGNMIVKTVSDLAVTTVVSSDIGVSIVPIPSDPNNFKTLRSTLIFDGPTAIDTPCENLMIVARIQQARYSKGKSYTVVNFNPTGPQDMVVIQDARDTKDYEAYIGLACDENNKCFEETEIWSFGGLQTAYVSVSNSKDTLTSLIMDKSSQLRVYNGSITPSNLLSVFNPVEFPDMLPLTFDGYIKQYVINGYASAINITRT